MATDDGSAVVEFVLVAIVMLVPLVYLLVAVAVVQRNQIAVTNAAREAGRAFATSTTPAEADARVAAAIRLALDSQHVPDDVEVRFVAAGGDCDSAQAPPSLMPGTQFTVCVQRRVTVPGVPHVLSGRGIRAVGRYVVHVDEFRTPG
ncbi:MAG TPA: TadE/TadG family type IV pilus assembly protein [Jatrophihabitantaceae bacterium]|nr:TadE/TadG family type IV pilus assembly protein [Jatrophihabitantaceae bacterium]